MYTKFASNPDLMRASAEAGAGIEKEVREGANS
jgi:hypothetical protein